MTLTLYNTLTRKKEPFRPIDPSNVRMYVCGPTVYDFAHIGNARPVIVFDVLFRLLRYLAAKGEWDGGKGETIVTYARNITDVDDKINARAAEEYPDLPLNEAIRRVTSKTEKQFHEDIAALGVLPPTVEPRATEHIDEMRRLCEILIENGHAYIAQDHVLFDVNSMPDYGRLANRSLEEMVAGARIDVAPYKKGPMDFVLWKPSKQAGVDGSNISEPAWPSPHGIERPGRPGWHIECSAMAAKHLGKTFDIHGGGIDLVFPHHENELAQTRCAFGVEVMATNWMHNGFLQVEDEKMSKSLGNFVTINQLLEAGWPGVVLRFMMLKTHYRQPINWARRGLMEATLELHKFAQWVGRLDHEPRSTEISPAVADALLDDLNTPQAIAELHHLLKSMSGYTQADDVQERRFDHLRNSLRLLGIGDLVGYDANRVAARITYGPSGRPSITDEEISRAIAARDAARKAKNFKEADRIRDELSGKGIQLNEIKDPATGEIKTTWEVKG